MQTEKKDPKFDDSRHEYIPGVQEKTSLGGAFNTGVTSTDPEEKEEIEKKGALANLKPKEEQDTENTATSTGD